MAVALALGIQISLSLRVAGLCSVGSVDTISTVFTRKMFLSSGRISIIRTILGFICRRFLGRGWQTNKASRRFFLWIKRRLRGTGRAEELTILFFLDIL